jgi:glycosyltransferase involved in cell wall biosynthesis
MEMQFGVLQRKEKLHAYFYIKDQQSDETDYPEMLKKLKEEVRNSDYPSSYYSSKENLAEQIEYLLSMSTEERRTLLIKQKERLTRFSWEKSAKQLADVYQSVINEKPHIH